MPDLSFYVPFFKVDVLSQDEVIITGIATDETPDAEGEITDYDATKEAAIEYADWRNIREMHEPSAVGVAETITLDDVTRSMVVTARIIGREVVKKIRAGVYKGFSIGGRKLAPPVLENRAGRLIKRITKYMLTEISLVDRPANPNAIFTVVKRESDMKDQLQKWLDMVKVLAGGDSVAADIEATIAKMDDKEMPEEMMGKEDNPPDPKEEASEPAAEQAREDNAPDSEKPAPPTDTPSGTPETAKAEGDLPTQPPPDTSVEAMTPDSVRELVMSVLMDVGLVRQMAGGQSSMAYAAEIGHLKKSLASFTKADDFQKVIGDVAAIVSALEGVGERLEAVEKARSQMGPVLRELGAFNFAGIETSTLEKMVSETADPQLKQQLGLQLVQAQIKAAQGNSISFNNK